MKAKTNGGTWSQIDGERKNKGRVGCSVLEMDSSTSLPDLRPKFPQWLRNLSPLLTLRDQNRADSQHPCPRMTGPWLQKALGENVNPSNS